MAVRAKELQHSAEPLHDYDDNFLDCRIDHDWKIIGMFHQGNETRRLAICKNCDSDRYQRWMPNGDALPTIYRYADGYQIEGGGVTRRDVRRELMGRRTVYQTEGTMRAALDRKAKNVRKRSTKTRPAARALRAVK